MVCQCAPNWALFALPSCSCAARTLPAARTTARRHLGRTLFGRTRRAIRRLVRGPSVLRTSARRTKVRSPLARSSSRTLPHVPRSHDHSCTSVRKKSKPKQNKPNQTKPKQCSPARPAWTWPLARWLSLAGARLLAHIERTYRARDEPRAAAERSVGHSIGGKVERVRRVCREQSQRTSAGRLEARLGRAARAAGLSRGQIYSQARQARPGN